MEYLVFRYVLLAQIVPLSCQARTHVHIEVRQEEQLLPDLVWIPSHSHRSVLVSRLATCDSILERGGEPAKSAEIVISGRVCSFGVQEFLGWDAP